MTNWKAVLRDWRLYVFGGLFLFNLFFALFLSVPRYFPAGTIVTVKKGSGLAEIAQELESEHIVRSAVWFRAAVIALGGQYGIQAGDYYLRGPQNAIDIAWRMAHGSFDLTMVKLTIPEGFTNEDIANLFDERFVLMNKGIFLSIAPQGYLFPDTYFVAVNATAGKAIELFQDNFDKRTAPLKAGIAASGHSLDEIVTMASIIEAEVKTQDDRELVSGILWKRLSLGIPLQVDSASSTYKNLGLPSEPIDNPGLESLEAAIYPKDSPYLYFLSDKSGVTHYAKTLEEHAKNIQKYL